MDADKQVEYWKGSAEEDFAAAESLLDSGHWRHCLFFAHLAIEKMLKAHVTRTTQDVPPRTHSLIRLIEIAGIELDVGREDFLREFGMYQLEGRYPDSEQLPLDPALTAREVAKAKEIFEWLSKQL